MPHGSYLLSLQGWWYYNWYGCWQKCRRQRAFRWRSWRRSWVHKTVIYKFATKRHMFNVQYSMFKFQIKTGTFNMKQFLRKAISDLDAMHFTLSIECWTFEYWIFTLTKNLSRHEFKKIFFHCTDGIFTGSNYTNKIIYRTVPAAVSFFACYQLVQWSEWIGIQQRCVSFILPA